MTKRNLIPTDFLDILFEGRNKEYGAYQLRKSYNNRLAKSLSITIAVCLLFAFGYALAGKSRQEKAMLDVSAPIVLSEARNEKTIIPPPPPKHTAQPIQVATIKSAIPQIVPDNKYDPKDAPPENTETDNAHIGTITSAGAPDGDITAPPVSNGDGYGPTQAPVKHDDPYDGIIDKVEIQSEYPGGIEAWKRFLSKTWHYPEAAIAEGIQGTVIVQFIVDKEGNVSQIQAISGPEELRKEAVRVVSRSGKWAPAIQNGHKVASYKKQPIVVQLVEE